MSLSTFWKRRAKAPQKTKAVGWWHFVVNTIRVTQADGMIYTSAVSRAEGVALCAAARAFQSTDTLTPTSWDSKTVERTNCPECLRLASLVFGVQRR